MRISSIYQIQEAQISNKVLDRINQIRTSMMINSHLIKQAICKIKSTNKTSQIRTIKVTNKQMFKIKFK